jgi:hypothetical protein
VQRPEGHGNGEPGQPVSEDEWHSAWQKHCCGSHRGDGHRPRLATRAEVRIPVEPDVIEGRGRTEDLQQDDRQAPLLSDAEMDQVGAEERESEAERDRPHERKPV